MVPKTVHPRDAHRLIMRRMSLPIAESRPVVGSSKHRRPGLVSCTREVPMDTRLASPPLMPRIIFALPMRRWRTRCRDQGKKERKKEGERRGKERVCDMRVSQREGERGMQGE